MHICNCKRTSSATPLFHKLGILKINELCQYEIGKLILPSSFSTLFTDISTVHKRQTSLRLTITFMYLNFLQIVFTQVHQISGFENMEFNFSRIEILILHKIQNNLQKTIKVVSGWLLDSKTITGPFAVSLWAAYVQYFFSVLFVYCLFCLINKYLHICLSVCLSIYLS